MSEAKNLACPECGGILKETEYPSDCMLNRDQWESSIAGDLYCDKCKSDAAATGYRYYWKSKLAGGSAPNADKTPEPSTLASATGCASPLEKYKVIAMQRQLEYCDKMLTDAGVPEWVITLRTDGVPANSVACRLEWFLARRKDVSKTEIDQKLQHEMKEMLRYAEARHNGEVRHAGPEAPK